MDEQSKAQFEKIRKRRVRKIGSLFFVVCITSVVLIVGSYAWFVGTSSVKTSSFTINIASEETLFLSLNGQYWTTELELSQSNIIANSTSYNNAAVSVTDANTAYVGNTNHWTRSTGMLPVSTSAEIDTTVSRLKIYEQSSITATAGGYRLMTSRFDNYNNSAAEGDSYVAFDLFVKNGDDPYYITTYDETADEAIYLTRDSSVVVDPAGNVSEDYGLANSIRVAFAQIGRIASTDTTASHAQGITCTDDTNVLGLCEDVTPTVWEPNDTVHNSHLTTYFNSVCKTRSSDGTYTSTACTPTVISPSGTAAGALANGNSVHTYVVNKVITSSDSVDIYDGINGYTVTATSDKSTAMLYDLDTFTDTEKNLTGQARPAFIKLASNSITKIRVYIYLEGQDIDNYDLISNGLAVKVNFGFTKDQRDMMLIS